MIGPPIAIACSADEAYARPLAAMVRSVQLTLSPSRSLDVWIVDRGVAAATRQRLLDSWASERCAVHWLTADARATEHLPVWGRMKAGTYDRLFVGALLPPTLERVLWLDCDLVTVADVARLYDEPLDGRTLLAAQDMVVPFVSSRFGVDAWREIGLGPRTPYFNAGVMVVDLARWRAERVMERALEYLDRRRERIWFWDQEALNVVLAGRWKAIDPRWNQVAGVAGRKFYRPEHLDEATYRLTVESPCVYHFAGTLKPWKYRGGGRAFTEWFDCLDRTAWAGWRPAPSLRGAALHVYDRYLRDFLYPFERWRLLAQRRWIRK